MPSSAPYSAMCFSYAAPTQMKTLLSGALSDEEVNDNGIDSPACSSLLGERDVAAGLEQQQQQGQHSPATLVHGTRHGRQEGSST
jgi:hypothetical protein